MNCNKTLDFIITNSIAKIPKETWDRLFGDIIEGYGYHKALEESGLAEMHFWYLIGMRGEKIVAIIPFFTMNLSYVDVIQGRLKKIMRYLQRYRKNAFNLDLLFVGTLASEEFYYGIDPDESLEVVCETALKKLEFFSRLERISFVVFQNVTDEQPALTNYFNTRGFISLETLPSTKIDIRADSLPGFIESLGPSTRKDIRRKLRKSQNEATLTTQVTSNVEDIIGEVYTLYSNNLTDSDISFEKLTPEFFLAIGKHMHDSAKFFITRCGEKIVAFNLCFIKNNRCIDKLIGFDTKVAHEYHLYYTTFCHNIEWCIANKIHTYQLGQTDYDPKLRLGAKLMPLRMYATTRNKFLDWLLQPLAWVITPNRFDPVLKKLKKGGMEHET